jgi:hypothetical protein
MIQIRQPKHSATIVRFHSLYAHRDSPHAAALELPQTVSAMQAWHYKGLGVLSAMAFHEKAGQSQVILLVFSWGKVLLPPSPTVATLPSALFDERSCFARCKLGVLVSVGAATC